MQRRHTHAVVAAIAILALVPQMAHSDLVIVSGDGTPGFYLVGPPAMPDNRQFYRNMLGDGDKVAILQTTFSFVDDELDEFYGTLGVQRASIATLDQATLSGVNLLLICFPSHSFAQADIAAMSQYLALGGSLFISGESAGLANAAVANASVNQVLSGLGLDIALVPAIYDTGLLDMVPQQIANHPLTAGMTNFRYRDTSAISGGAPLFYTRNGTPFMAVAPQPGLVPLAGDFNRDRHVTASDIPAMLSALTNLDKYRSDFALTAQQLLAIGDIDGNQTIDNTDLQSFLTLLASGGGTTVPEPAAWMLALVGCTALALGHLRQI